MKRLYTLFALGAAFAINSAIAGETGSCCSATTTTALSPRAAANQTIVASGKEDSDLARADLGAGARAKASAAYKANLAAGTAKDVDMVRGRELGVAARAKATGNTGSATIEIAPLK